MTGAVYGRTPYLGLGLINFNFPNWADDANKNMKIVDAGYSMTGLAIRGMWENGTAYVIGDIVVDDAAQMLWRCYVNHTAAPSGTFAQDREAHPDYWAPYTSIPTLIHTGDDPPAVPENGMLWWNPTTAVLCVWYEDEDSGQWVSVVGPAGPMGPQGVQGPIGIQGEIGPMGPAQPGKHVYMSIEAGLAGTVSGETFWVYITGDSFMHLYRNSSGFAVLESSLPLVPADVTGARALIGDYTTALAMDFTVPGTYEIVRLDAATPANNYSGNLRGWSNFALDWGPITRATVQSNGKLRFGAENRFLSTNDFTVAGWVKTGITAAFELDGTTKLTATGAAAHIAKGSITLGSLGRWRSVCVLAKKGTTDWVFINSRDGSVDARTWFNLNTGVIGTTDATHRAFIYTQATCPFDDVIIPSGWFLIGVAHKGVSTNGTPQIGISDANGAVAVTIGKTAFIQKSQAIVGTQPVPYLDITATIITAGLPYDWRQGYRAILIEPFTRNYRGQYSDELQQAIWIKTNCTALLDVVGPHNELCSTVTATADVATVLQTTTLASTSHCTTVWLRRKTGVGAISLMLNGQEKLVTLTSTWQRFTDVWAGTSAVAIYGIKLATSGDAIEVSMLNSNVGGGTKVPATDIVVDATVPVAVSGDAVNIPTTDFPSANTQMLFLDIQVMDGGGGILDQYGYSFDASNVAQPRRNVYIYYTVFTSTATVSLTMGDYVPGQRAEITVRMKPNDHAATMNGIGASFTKLLGAITQGPIGMNGAGSSPYWLRRLLTVPTDVPDDQLETWRYGGGLHDSRYLHDVVVAKHKELPEIESQREAAITLYAENATSANGLLHWNDEGTVAGVGVHTEQPGRVRARTWSVNKTTRRISLGTSFVLSEPAAWATGYGHHQSHIVMKQTVGSERGRIWYIYAQLDSVAGTISPTDFRRIYATYSDDNLVTQSAPQIIYDPGSSKYALGGPSGNYVEYPADSAYPGRLVFPYYSSVVTQGLIYRDPGGAWTAGATVYTPGRTEPALALLPNGNLLMETRAESGPHGWALFGDGGTTSISNGLFAADPSWQVVSMSLSQIDPTGAFGPYGKVLMVGSRSSVGTYGRSGLTIEALTGIPPVLSGQKIMPVGTHRYCGYVSSQALSGGLMLVAYEESGDHATNQLDNLRMMLVDISEFGGNVNMAYNFPNNPTPGDIFTPPGSPVSWHFSDGIWKQIVTLPPEYQEAVDAAELAATNAEIAETNAETAETNAEAAQAAAELSESNAELAEINAEAAQVAAQNAADASFALGPKYADEPTGRAAVANGAVFLVVGTGDIACHEYRRVDASSSTYLTNYPTANAVSIADEKGSYARFAAERAARYNAHPKALVLVFLGQSNNAMRGTALPVATPPGAYMPVGGNNPALWDFYATNAEWVVHWNEFATVVPHLEGTGETPISGALSTVLGGYFPRAYTCSVAVPARSLDTLSNTGPRCNLYAAVQRLCEHARVDGFQPFVAYSTHHGEADMAVHTANPPATAETEYYNDGMLYYRMAQLAAAQAMEKPDYIAPIVFHHPILMGFPADGSISRVIHNVIRRFANDIPNAIYGGGCYHYDSEADRTHQEEAGFRMRGEHVGHLLRRYFETGVREHALEIVDVSWSGTTATVIFTEDVVRDTSYDWGTNLNPTKALAGFEWVDNGTDIQIIAVTVQGRKVVLTLATTPVGTLAQQKLRIAAQTTGAANLANANNRAGSQIRVNEIGRSCIVQYGDARYGIHYRWAVPQLCDVRAA